MNNQQPTLSPEAVHAGFAGMTHFYDVALATKNQEIAQLKQALLKVGGELEEMKKQIAALKPVDANGVPTLAEIAT